MIRRVTSSRDRVEHGGAQIPAAYRSGHFLPVMVVEELVEEDGYTSYRVTFVGGIVKRNGEAGLQQGKRTYTRATRRGEVTHDDLDHIPMSLRSALRGEQSLRDQRFQ